MSSATASQKRWTPEEYLAMERESTDRHQFVDGEIYLMAGCNRRHDRIAINIVSTLDGLLSAGACEPFSSDMKIHIPATRSFYYPDASVACGPIFADEKEDVLVNPCVIFEVLSDSTEAFDRGTKFEDYRSISTLKEYVLVSQHKMLVEHFTCQRDGRWLLQTIREEKGLLQLGCFPAEVPIAAFYRRIIFAPR